MDLGGIPPDTDGATLDKLVRRDGAERECGCDLCCAITASIITASLDLRRYARPTRTEPGAVTNLDSWVSQSSRQGRTSGKPKSDVLDQETGCVKLLALL